MDKPVLVMLPPTIRTQQNAQRKDEQVYPGEVIARVQARMTREAESKKWPFRIVPAEDAEAVYLSVASTPRNPQQDIPFAFLKPMAEKLKARYLLCYAINELTAYRAVNSFQSMTRGRADIALYVYDSEADEYIWQRAEKADSGRPSTFNLGSLAARLDQAMINALVRALEPFAKGQRMKIERPTANVIAVVQKSLSDGKKVLLDVGRAQNLREGEVFRSVESDCEIRVVEVLENGSLAEVLSGTPKEKEVFKPRKP